MRTCTFFFSKPNNAKVRVYFTPQMSWACETFFLQGWKNAEVWVFTDQRCQVIVSWCFKPSEPHRIILGLRETFTKRHIIERTKKAEIRPEEQSEKSESCRENLRRKYSWKGLKDRYRHRNRVKRKGQAWLVHVKNINRNITTTWRWAHMDPMMYGQCTSIQIVHLPS